MNRDRCPDMYMPMESMVSPRSEASWGTNMPMRSEPPWGTNMANMPMRSEPPWGANMANMPMRSENTMGLGMKECIDHETVLEDVQLAHAYVPFQKWCPTFTPMTALKKGTAFPGLIDVYGWERRHGMGGDLL